MKRRQISTPAATTPAPVSVPNPTPNAGIPALVPGDETAQILAAIWTNPLVVVEAAPGAGKTYRATAVCAHLAHEAGLNVLVATSTNAQANDFASRLAACASAIEVTLVTSNANVNTTTPIDPRVTVSSSIKFNKRNQVVVATAAKLQYAKEPTNADVLVVDEAWQQNWFTFQSITHHVGDNGPDSFLLIGDPGQVDPVTTIDTDRFDDQLLAPHKPAPEVVLAAHGDKVITITLPTTRRIGPATTELIAPLYRFDLSSLRPPTEWRANPTGPGSAEFTHRVVEPTGGQADEAVIAAIADEVRDALSGFIVDPNGLRPVAETDIAVVCPHNAQVAAIAPHVPNGVLVTTVDKVQGLERDVVVIHDPLAGQLDAGEFHLDTGRLCVALSRARAQMRWVTTTEVPRLLADSDHPDADLNIEIRNRIAA